MYGLQIIINNERQYNQVCSILGKYFRPNADGCRVSSIYPKVITLDIFRKKDTYFTNHIPLLITEVLYTKCSCEKFVTAYNEVISNPIV